MTNSKKYTHQAKSCIKGEAYFETLISDYAIPNKIFAPKDLGNDFICEWVKDDIPTGLIFIVQIKTVGLGKCKIIPSGICSYNKLEQVYIKKNTNLRIERRTLKYWKAFGLPTYLFAMLETKNSQKFDCFYKRYTPILTTSRKPEDEPFFKVNEGNRFIAHDNTKKYGFLRDLYIDYVRWNYFKGNIQLRKAKEFGLNQYSKKFDYFEDLFREYEKSIRRTTNFLNGIIEQYDQNS